MARPQRVLVPGLTTHVIQRGNDKMPIFRSEADREVFLAFLESAAHKEEVETHAYVLMTNHFHLMITPPAATAIPRMMRRLGGRYVGYFNRTYGRIGTLWNGRYRSLVIEDQVYWLTCLRYIEQNPVRAGMVETPDAYRWSSYAAHAFGNWPKWLVSHPVYDALGSAPDQRQATYRGLCAIPLGEAEVVVARYPLGPVGGRVGSDPAPTPL